MSKTCKFCGVLVLRPCTDTRASVAYIEACIGRMRPAVTTKACATGYPLYLVEHGYTVAQAAREAGISQTTLRKQITGKILALRGRAHTLEQALENSKPVL